MVTDEGLLAAMAAGDTQAAAVFVRRHSARVFGLALAVVGTRGLAEEVAQDAFVRAWRYAGAFDPRRGAATTWLLAITRNAAIDAMRACPEDPVEPDRLMDLLGATAATDDLADSQRIRQALHRLPGEQARAVVLATFYGLTAREIAEREGVPLGTAKTRIRLGLSRLRDQLGAGDE
ncbi:RNA polymerase sigma-70 factor (ECF subfamily) [Allocatelliglobosispora scoriae]|uniref:RNA polymerase sigma factor n=1 Tax=Allocatelliglobosispora scoriae TaxID=643052 RepID=A0A841BQ74_9ACTN|nr:sigma-70 family RNA polymerase sigma factor [Allocatelliglobosispora scoriae]MBB5869093.1 RNA polymerase sigma-70 factor (ECF subfamily) [Allocatelliglobosispora scoriae]